MRDTGGNFYIRKNAQIQGRSQPTTQTSPGKFHSWSDEVSFILRNCPHCLCLRCVKKPEVLGPQPSINHLNLDLNPAPDPTLLDIQSNAGHGIKTHLPLTVNTIFLLLLHALYNTLTRNSEMKDPGWLCHCFQISQNFPKSNILPAVHVSLLPCSHQ